MNERERPDDGTVGGCGCSTWIGLLVVVLGFGLVRQLGGRFVVTVLAAGAAAVAVVAVLAFVWRRLLPARASRVLSMIATSKEESGRFRLRRLCRRGSVWHVAWRVPVGVTVTGLLRQREAIEQALDASVDLWYDRGKLHMRAGTARLPGGLRFAVVPFDMNH